MSSPFVAEIRIFPFNFAPKGWAFCNGQLLTISQNTALFSLLGTTYGGDGKSNFALPNLQGSSAMHTTQYAGNSPFGQFNLGQSGGEDTVNLPMAMMPTHTHNVQADFDHRNATSVNPAGAVQVQSTGNLVFSSASGNTTMNPSLVSIAGGSQPHNNLMPYLTMSYCICLQGVFPARP